MKYFLVVVAIFALNSCNTSIGLYRDTKSAFFWTKGKIQGAGSDGGGGGEVDYGAPVY